MKKLIIIFLALPVLVTAGCATVPERPEGKTVLGAKVQEAISAFKTEDPTIERFFKGSYGYVVLPEVFKGAFLVGGAFGNGEVYEQGKIAGYSSMSQATFGFSLGGEYFREIVFFRDKMDLDKFKTEEIVFAAQITGVAITSGAAAKADYKAGMAVFIMPDKGLMVDASLGGQKFKYVPNNP
jgi:lipid-binding SYLF domain-containing protein